jgi:hypothetical protein
MSELFAEVLLVGAVLACTIPLSVLLCNNVLLPSFKEARKKRFAYTSVWKRSVFFSDDVCLSDSYINAIMLYRLGLFSSPLIGALTAYLIYQRSTNQAMMFSVSLATGCVMSVLVCALCAAIGRGIIHPLWTEKQAEIYYTEPRCAECSVVMVTGGCPNTGCSNYLFRDQVRRESKPVPLGRFFGVQLYDCPNNGGKITDFYRNKAEQLERERDSKIKRSN